MTQPADAHYFTENAVREWRNIGARHRLRDEQFLRRIERYFRPGPILELGAATGHLSAILQEHGLDVTASDISPRFVAAIAERGVPAKLVDAAANIEAQTGRTFANVLAQGVIPLIRRDRATVCSTLARIYSALEPDGRFVCISPHARHSANPQAFFRPREQLEIAQSTGLFRTVDVFPHQVLPPALYRRWNARLLNLVDFHVARLAAVRLVWVMEKIGP